MSIIIDDGKSEIPENARVFVAGRTGTGKSYATEAYLAGFHNVVKLDTKDETGERRANNEPIWRGIPEKEITVVTKLENLQYAQTNYIIYVPDFEEQTDEYYNEFFKWCYLRENCTVWVDELMSVSTSYKFPQYLQAIMTRGRSKNVGIWALTQRPTGIPSIVTANCNYFMIFDLNLMEDRQKVSQVTGMQELKNQPSSNEYPYAFWYYEINWYQPELMELIIS